MPVCRNRKRETAFYERGGRESSVDNFGCAVRVRYLSRDGVTMNDQYCDVLRAEFLRLLTKDSVTKDRRRKDFNQAIFMDNGLSIWSQTTLDMVMYAFDRAVKRTTEHMRERA